MYYQGRSRWVIYNEKFGLNYDGSQIDPIWHGWIHYTTDEPPTVKKPIMYPWVTQELKENKTGTRDQYVPYSTVKPKIEAWNPNK
jgi:NADH dehydrogenase (ubiquinone) 1 alpha subcomplex subunit 12